MMKRKRDKKFKKETTGCFFCQENKKPDYKNIQDLEEFTTDRGRIIARLRTGVCQKHQRRLSQAVKRARFLALLPFVTRV